MSTTALATMAIGAAGLGFYLGYSPSSGNNVSADQTLATTVVDEPEEDSATLIAKAQRIPDGDLSLVKPGFSEPCKLVLVVRTDFKMPPGKVSSLCAGATLQCYTSLSKANPKVLQHWERFGQAKIALKGKSEAQLEELEHFAKALNLCARATRFENEEGQETPAVLAIGPGPISLINEVTGKLKLL